MYVPLLAAIFDVPVTPISESIHVSPTMVLDPEKLVVAVGCSVKSYSLRYDDNVYVLPVNGGRLQFTSHPDVGEYPQMSRRVAGPKNGGTRRNFDDITFKS